jgi:septum site-determining protein MinC
VPVAVDVTSAAPQDEPAQRPLVFSPTLVVEGPLRSGQRIYARGGDLVVLSLVSHGAEVIADGSVHVYGPLRGRAIAGAKGDTGARIYSTAMDPQLVSIAGIYRTTEVALPAEVLGQPAQVRLDGERLVVEPLRG